MDFCVEDSLGFQDGWQVENEHALPFDLTCKTQRYNVLDIFLISNQLTIIQASSHWPWRSSSLITATRAQRRYRNDKPDWRGQGRFVYWQKRWRHLPLGGWHSCASKHYLLSILLANNRSRRQRINISFEIGYFLFYLSLKTGRQCPRIFCSILLYKLIFWIVYCNSLFKYKTTVDPIECVWLFAVIVKWTIAIQ